ncbi:leucine-rich repeat domain-containing protein [uncultured Senegalimassilia sp.]|uniref:leucine-rich repeat domain-containing protein n=1 Tax=uncultured Senegalimassilia sp. TaxID=1714350 RepID=UPI0025DD6C05|nr:leucine-rich repeat domain-containing protein [uncultured Senegalimassilia sp.]
MTVGAYIPQEPKWLQRRCSPVRPIYKQGTVTRPGRGLAGKKPDDGIAVFFLEADVGGCERANTAKHYQMLHVGDRLDLKLTENESVAMSFQKDGECYHLGFLNEQYAITAGVSILLRYPSAFGVIGDIYATVTELDLKSPKWPRAYIEIRCLSDVRLRHAKRGFLLTPDETVVVKLLETHVKITIPDGVKEIAPYAFSRDLRIRSVVLPAGLRKIGHHAFASTNISEVNIPASVEDIGFDAFANCPYDRCLFVGNANSSLVRYKVEKENARYKSNRGKLKDTQATKDREKRPFEDFGYYMTISMPWANSRYMTKDDMPALAELIAQRDARRKEKWARPTPTMLADKCIKELQTRGSSPTLETVLAKFNSLSGLKRNELVFAVAESGGEEQFNMMLATAAQSPESLSFLLANAISRNDHDLARRLAQAGTRLHSKRMRIPDNAREGKTILCTPIELALQDVRFETAAEGKTGASVPYVDNSSCIAALAEEGLLTRENLRELYQGVRQSAAPFAQERLQAIVRFVYPDGVTDKLDLCKNLIANKAQAELEHAFTWPNFPTIDQLETLVRFANESGDTEMAVRILESYRNQQPPEPTEGLML